MHRHPRTSSLPAARLGVCRVAPEKEVYLCHLSPTAAPLSARVVQRGPWGSLRRTWHDKPPHPHRASTRETAVRAIADGVSAATGEAFFRSLMQYLATTLAADFAFVGEVSPSTTT